MNHTTDLNNFCKLLADRYNDSLESYYRVKYNALYPILNDPISEEKKSELWQSFRTSLNNDPIKEITDNGIVFNKM